MFNDVADEGKGIIIADGPLVQCSVVPNGAKLTALFLVVKQGGGIW